MTMISYAENHEDVVLNRLPTADGLGSYIDLGAGDPLVDSVTKYFYDQGWAGINVEPDARLFAALVEHRTRDVNLHMDLSDPQAMLAKICGDHVLSTVDFLSVRTAEGQREILEGGDWTRWRPRVVVVRSNLDGAAPEWEQVLLDAQYLVAAFDGQNRFYLRAEDSELLPALATPANTADRFIPYRYSHLVVELRECLETSRREYRDLEARLQDAQRVLRMTRVGLADAHALFLQLLDEVVDVRAQCQDISRRIEGIHPLGMGLARRVTKVSARFPKAFAGGQWLADARLARKRAEGWEPD